MSFICPSRPLTSPSELQSAQVGWGRWGRPQAPSEGLCSSPGGLPMPFSVWGGKCSLIFCLPWSGGPWGSVAPLVASLSPAHSSTRSPQIVLVGACHLFPSGPRYGARMSAGTGPARTGHCWPFLLLSGSGPGSLGAPTYPHLAGGRGQPAGASGSGCPPELFLTWVRARARAPRPLSRTRGRRGWDWGCCTQRGHQRAPSGRAPS